MESKRNVLDLDGTLIDTLGSFSALLEVLSTPIEYSLQPKVVKVNSKYSVKLDVLRYFYDSSECKVLITLQVVSNSSQLPVHTIELTKAGYLKDKSSVYYTVRSAPHFRGNVRSDLVSGRTMRSITVSDLKSVVMTDNIKSDVFKAISTGSLELIKYLFSSLGLKYRGV